MDSILVFNNSIWRFESNYFMFGFVGLQNRIFVSSIEAIQHALPTFIEIVLSFGQSFAVDSAQIKIQSMRAVKRVKEKLEDLIHLIVIKRSCDSYPIF